MEIKYFLNRLFKRVPEKIDEKNRSLILAAYYGHAEMAAILSDSGTRKFEVGGDFFIYNNMSALHIATDRGHIKTVIALIKKGGSKINFIHLNEKTTLHDIIYNSETALHIATRNGNIEMVTTLLEMGAKTDIKNRDGNTAIDIAIKNGNSELIKVFNNHENKKNIRELGISSKPKTVVDKKFIATKKIKLKKIKP